VAAAAARKASRADHPPSDRLPWEAYANDEPLGILVFAGVRFAAFGRVQEKPSAPQTRLACNHLQELLRQSIGATTKKE
jgi:hypothetical protein